MQNIFFTPYIGILVIVSCFVYKSFLNMMPVSRRGKSTPKFSIHQNIVFSLTLLCEGFDMYAENIVIIGGTFDPRYILKNHYINR